MTPAIRNRDELLNAISGLEPVAARQKRELIEAVYHKLEIYNKLSAVINIVTELLYRKKEKGQTTGTASRVVASILQYGLFEFLISNPELLKTAGGKILEFIKKVFNKNKNRDSSPPQSY